MTAHSYTIERYESDAGDLEAITALLHRAYAPLVAAGMDYIAATQPVEMTEKRLRAATASWVARVETRIAGMLCYHSRVTYPGAPDWYAMDGVAVFAQFAVEPALQKRGIGYALLDAARRHAVNERNSELACDTAEQARHLREYYARYGFREVAIHRWPQATYDSVVFSLSLNGDS